MKYFIIAGEASGDLHASFLMKELKERDPKAEFCYFGGDLMAAQGGILLKHYREMAFMGLFPVLMNLHKIKQNFNLAERKLQEFNPDVLILVDYPGFNLRMAAFAKSKNFRVYYYISPKIWAWKTKRVYKIQQFVDEMFTIFPFETDFYNKYAVKVHYVGNPTVDELSLKSFPSFSDFISKNNLSDKPIIALLAGSRSQEISRILPVMAKVTGRFPQFQYVIAGAPSQNIHKYAQALGSYRIPVVFGQTYDLLKHSTAALVASGTATLETAVLNVPQVVCYRVEAGKLGGLVKEWLIKVPFISLVNLITGREVVRELFQEKCTPELVGNELDRILSDSQYKMEILNGYREMLERLGGPGCAKRAAAQMTELLKEEL